MKKINIEKFIVLSLLSFSSLSSAVAQDVKILPIEEEVKKLDDGFVIHDSYHVPGDNAQKWAVYRHSNPEVEKKGLKYKIKKDFFVENKTL